LRRWLNMIKQESRDVERKEVAILKILKDSREPIGATSIAYRLKDYGIDLTERAVRYHLKIMDERGLTHLVGRRHGRLITESGINELDSALVGNRVGSAMTNIEMLICQTSLELEKLRGEVPVNISLFPEEKFSRGLEIMRSFSSTPLCSSDMVFVAASGEKLGDFVIPEGRVGFATLSNVTISAVLFKAGILLDFRFAGVLQVRNYSCHRFIDLIEYTGSSLNPYEVFLSCKMTHVNGVAGDGNGKILASFCELPAFTLPKVEAITRRLEKVGIRSVTRLGGINEPLCEIAVGTGRFGMILADGLNLVAAAVEAGIEVENHASCSLLEFNRMRSLCDI
jgi:repressor of nif and glnA expression